MYAYCARIGFSAAAVVVIAPVVVAHTPHHITGASSGFFWGGFFLWLWTLELQEGHLGSGKEDGGDMRMYGVEGDVWGAF